MKLFAIYSFLILGLASPFSASAMPLGGDKSINICYAHEPLYNEADPFYTLQIRDKFWSGTDFRITCAGESSHMKSMKYIDDRYSIDAEDCEALVNYIQSIVIYRKQCVTVSLSTTRVLSAR